MKKYRELRGFTQEELALIVGLHRTYISDIERGKRNVSVININAIAKGLNITMAELFEKTEELMRYEYQNEKI